MLGTNINGAVRVFSTFVGSPTKPPSLFNTCANITTPLPL
jgi:hypothetical protein